MSSENYSAFSYGFLFSQVSQALQHYLRKGKIDPDEKAKLQDGYRLLLDITTAQKLFTEEKSAVAPSRIALDAFNCALEVILANKESFGVRDVSSFINLFNVLCETLKALIERPEKSPKEQDITTARTFFKKLAEAMLAEVSLPKEVVLNSV